MIMTIIKYKRHFFQLDTMSCFISLLYGVSDKKKKKTDMFVVEFSHNKSLLFA